MLALCVRACERFGTCDMQASCSRLLSRRESGCGCARSGPGRPSASTSRAQVRPALLKTQPSGRRSRTRPAGSPAVQTWSPGPDCAAGKRRAWMHPRSFLRVFRRSFQRCLALGRAPPRRRAILARRCVAALSAHRAGRLPEKTARRGSSATKSYDMLRARLLKLFPGSVSHFYRLRCCASHF